VGDFELDASFQTFLKGLGFAPPVFQDAYSKSTTLAEAVRTYVNALFGEKGLLVLDANDARLKREFVEVMASDLFEQKPYAAAQASTQALEQLGYASQIYPRPINLFYLEKGIRDRIEQEGHDFPLLIAGGSPTFAIHSTRRNVECSPGTFIFWDKGYHDALPEQDFLYAALVLTRVISLPDESKICIDLGHKSIASENELLKRAYFLNAPELKPIGQNEEHMIIEVGKGHNYKIGDVLFALPIHICPTVALYDHATVIENGRASGNWKIIARDRKITY
jgi:D-serine deaminase-like pyridoxal phosphate-dependent protein